MIGRGVYSGEADDLLLKHEAKIVFLGIVEGKNGSQCEVAGNPEDMGKLPAILRDVADKIEQDYSLRSRAE